MALTDGLLAFYKLEDTSDASGGGFNLTNNNTCTFTSALVNNGVSTGASNTNKSLTSTTQFGLATTDDRTISCWVKVIGSQFEGAGNNTFISMSYSNLVYDITGASSSTIIMGTLRPGVGNNEYTATHTISTSAFSHLVICNTGTAGKAYINGTNVGTWTIATGGAAGGSGFSIGKLNFSSDIWYSSAVIDAVGIWNRELSSGEITSLYNGGAGLEYDFTGGGGGATFSPRTALLGVGR